MRALAVLLSISTAALALAGCKADEVEPKTEAAATTAADATTPDEPKPTADAASSSELERLLAWMPAEPYAVVYDRLGERLDPDVLEVVFGIPPKAAHMLDERKTLDDALALDFEGESEAGKWLAPQSFGFTIALSRSPYFLRPLSKPVAEVESLLRSAGYTQNTIDGVEVWLPSGSFPWRIALLEGDVAAFIPVDVPGAGLDPLLPERLAAEKNPAEAAPAEAPEAPPPAAPEAPDAAGSAMVEAALRRSLTEDPLIELVLISRGPLVSFDVDQPLAQAQFILRRAAPMASNYDGELVLTPTGDPDECANDLRARKYPEENQQVQALIAAVLFDVVEGQVVAHLKISTDQIKHFLLR